ncbi:hypothetical protein PLANPX_1189 [Lacipirellula parvula]|uniref:Uncharacterized protein n=1 Tax=Lacipirellula parvula TaxID=2650471 RepID=A0A5K7X6V5_9BACT|nr:hypothetical protein PLANPX_1189 [Lacipirellula parvula]
MVRLQSNSRLLEQPTHRLHLKRPIRQRPHQIIQQPAIFDLRIKPASVLPAPRE